MKYLILTLLTAALAAATPAPVQPISGLAGRDLFERQATCTNPCPDALKCRCTAGTAYCCLGAPTFACEFVGSCLG